MNINKFSFIAFVMALFLTSLVSKTSYAACSWTAAGDYVCGGGGGTSTADFGSPNDLTPDGVVLYNEEPIENEEAVDEDEEDFSDMGDDYFALLDQIEQMDGCEKEIANIALGQYSSDFTGSMGIDENDTEAFEDGQTQDDYNSGVGNIDIRNPEGAACYDEPDCEAGYVEPPCNPPFSPQCQERPPCVGASCDVEYFNCVTETCEQQHIKCVSPFSRDDFAIEKCQKRSGDQLEFCETLLDEIEKQECIDNVPTDYENCLANIDTIETEDCNQALDRCRIKQDKTARDALGPDGVAGDTTLDED